jgi:beta-galactosidase GanA
MATGGFRKEGLGPYDAASRMSKSKRVLTGLGFALLATTALASAIPTLRRQGTTTQLIVDGSPFLIRGGELGNSSGEPDYLKPFWPKLAALNLNAVVAPVSWELVEPQEGTFDFATVDGLIADARANRMRLVLLWFGAWKNSMSCYAPAWVKREVARFPRSRDSAGRNLEILSPFSLANRDADAKAFGAFMRHLRAVDGGQHTVVLVQVENEIGMIPEARDRAPDAEKAFAGPVPAELMTYLTQHADTLAPELRATWTAAGARRVGTWTEVFGRDAAAEEIFMAWYFARFVQHLTVLGKAELPLPMFVNAALIRPGHAPGQYPSAGPLPHLLDVWRAGAPAIDFLAPDIYFQNFAEWSRRYTRGGNALFIPEALRTPEASVNGLYAIAGLGAMGFSPFGIESITDPAARWLGDSYDVVAQLTPLITAHQGKGTMVGLLSEGAEQRQPQQVMLGDTIILVSFDRGGAPSLADGAVGTPNAGSPAGGFVIATGPDEFLFAGIGLVATFQSRTPGAQAGLLSVEEGRFTNGAWKHLRWLNGDQTHQGRHVRLEPGRFGIQRVKLYRY